MRLNNKNSDYKCGHIRRGLKEPSVSPKEDEGTLSEMGPAFTFKYGFYHIFELGGDGSGQWKSGS